MLLANSLEDTCGLEKIREPNTKHTVRTTTRDGVGMCVCAGGRRGRKIPTDCDDDDTDNDKTTCARRLSGGNSLTRQRIVHNTREPRPELNGTFRWATVDADLVSLSLSGEGRVECRGLLYYGCGGDGDWIRILYTQRTAGWLTGDQTP